MLPSLHLKSALMPGRRLNSSYKSKRFYSRVPKPTGLIAPESSKAQELVRLGGRKLDAGSLELKQIEEDLWLIPEFISKEEEARLIEEINPLFRKKRYIDTHWDGVITGYKEIEKSFWMPHNQLLIQRVKNILPHSVRWLPGVHVLDLAANGPIDAHIDSVSASGGILAGLSLASRSVMTLKRPNCEPISMNLEPRSLYVMLGDIRYEYTHEIPANESVWDGERIPRDRRISIMFRDALPVEQNSDDGIRVFKLTEDGAVSL